MDTASGRPGRAGILVTLVLMFSVVMFAGAIFWLITDAGLLMGDPNTGLFDPATAPETPMTLNQTIIILQQGGCMVAYYPKDYVGGYEQVTYDVFVEEAASAKIVYRVKNQEGLTVLLLETQKDTLEWIPED